MELLVGYIIGFFISIIFFTYVSQDDFDKPHDKPHEMILIFSIFWVVVLPIFLVTALVTYFYNEIYVKFIDYMVMKFKSLEK